MFIIESRHPDGWHQQGTASVEYWACQEAQLKCCADGLPYRIRNAETEQIVALVDPSSCRTPTPAP